MIGRWPFIVAQADEQHQGFRTRGRLAGAARTSAVFVIIIETSPDALGDIGDGFIDDDHDVRTAVANANKDCGQL